MKAKGKTESAWWHLVEHHNLPSLSQRSYTANKKLWAEVDAEFHRLHADGAQASLEV